ncbi:MAG: methyltransferase [Hyphomicrobium sp.]|jgi:predicted RNA methylase
MPEISTGPLTTFTHEKRRIELRVDNDVLAVLSRAETNGNALMLVGQLDRKMYERTNKVLVAAGGKWNKKAKAHLFEYEASTRVDQIILSGEVEVPKDEFNFFPSPPDIVARLMALADVQHGMRVLEPSAGRGAIAYACSEAGATVDCYELMEANFTALVKDARLGSVRHMDFLAQTPDPSYDRVVMNPPFAKQADIQHVLHALRFLKPGALLVSVMAASVVFRDNKLTQGFRDLIRERGGDIETLPDGAFKESGTMVRTVIATIPDKG